MNADFKLATTNPEQNLTTEARKHGEQQNGWRQIPWLFFILLCAFVLSVLLFNPR
jgi:hypothetical protein